MKQFIIFILLPPLLFLSSTIAQDILYLQDGSRVHVSVQQIDSTNIYFLPEGKTDGDFLSFSKQKVTKILYADSSVVEIRSPIQTQEQVSSEPTTSLLATSTAIPPSSRNRKRTPSGFRTYLGIGASAGIGIGPELDEWQAQQTFLSSSKGSNTQVLLQQMPLGGAQAEILFEYKTKGKLSIHLGAGIGQQVWEVRLRETYSDPEFQYDAYWDSAHVHRQTQAYVPLGISLQLSRTARLEFQAIGFLNLESTIERRTAYHEVVNGKRNGEAELNEIKLQQVNRAPDLYPGARIGFSFGKHKGVQFKPALLWQGAPLLLDHTTYHNFYFMLGLGYQWAN